MITDAQNQIVAVNQAFEGLTGYVEAEVQGKDAGILLLGCAGGSCAGFPTTLAAAKWTGDIQGRHKDGRTYDRELHVAVVRDDSGKPTHHIATFYDVASRKFLENSLAESQQLLHTLISSSPNFVLVKDADERWLMASPPLLELFQLEGKDWQHRTDAEIAQLSDSAFSRSLQQSLAMDRTAWSVQSGIWRSTEDAPQNEGGARLFELIKNPMLDEKGKVKPTTVPDNDVALPASLQRGLEYRASHDPLTGLANRMLLRERLEQSLAWARQQHAMLSVCVLSLDNFKTINDKYGEETGSDLLALVAQRLQSTIRAHDTLARLGDDEFALVLTAIESVSQLHTIGKRLLSVLRKPAEIEGEVFNVRGSVGMVLYGEDHHTQTGAGVLLRQAHQAMHEARKSPKRGYSIFDKDVENDVETP